MVTPNKPHTHNGDLATLVNSKAFGELTKEKRWLCWSWVHITNKDGTGKWTKVPRRPSNPSKNASATEPESWGTFQQALSCVAAGHADGVGYALMGSSIGALDLDHCRDAQTNQLAPWAQEICNQAKGCYKEVTFRAMGFVLSDPLLMAERRSTASSQRTPTAAALNYFATRADISRSAPMRLTNVKDCHRLTGLSSSFSPNSSNSGSTPLVEAVLISMTLDSSRAPTKSTMKRSSAMASPTGNAVMCFNQ